METPYKSIKEFFSKPVPEYISDAIDRQVQEDTLYEDMRETYPFLTNKTLFVLFQYYMCNPKQLGLKGDDTIIFSAHKELFFKGEMGPLFIFKRLEKIGYSPKIAI